jgi:general nucleoside transport system permease protein
VTTQVHDVPPPAEELPGPEATFASRFLDAIRYGNTFVLTLLAIVLALVIGAVLIVAADPATRTAMGYFFQSPADTFRLGWHAIWSGYENLFTGSIIDPSALSSGSTNKILYPISLTLEDATPLILGGLSVGVAFRAGLFNIGGQGQIIAGAICASYVGFAWNLPPFVHVVVAIIAGTIGGALWGAIAGVLKARTGAHEVITTIMLNYVALYLLDYLLSTAGFQNGGSGQAISRPIHGNAMLPHLLGDALPVNAGLLIALAAALGCWWLLTRSTLGFSLRAVGANQNAARTAGMSVARNTIIVMIIAGALCGLAGVCQAVGTSNSAITNSVDAGIGFNAITVALLGRASPGGTVLAGLLFGALQAGSVKMLANTGTPVDLVNILQSLIVLFIAAPALIRSVFRLRAARGGGPVQLAKGWNG